MKIVQNILQANDHDTIVACIDMGSTSFTTQSRHDHKMDYFHIAGYPHLTSGDEDHWDNSIIPVNLFLMTLDDSTCVEIGQFYNQARRVFDESPAEYHTMLIAKLVEELDRKISLVELIKTYIKTSQMHSSPDLSVLAESHNVELSDMTVLNLLTKLMFPIWGELLAPYGDLQYDHLENAKYVECLKTINVGSIKPIIDRLHAHVNDHVEKRLGQVPEMIKEVTAEISTAELITKRYVMMPIQPGIIGRTYNLVDQDLPTINTSVSESFTQVFGSI